MKLYIIEFVISFTLSIIAFIKLRDNGHATKQFYRVRNIIGLLLVISFGLTFLLEKPELQITKEVSVEVNSQEATVTPKATYHFHDVSDKVQVVGQVDYNQVGEYEINYEVPTIFGNYKKNQSIKVIDTVAPEITLQGEEEYKQSYAKKYKEPGYKAVDKHDGDLTDKVKIEKRIINNNEIDIVYTVADNSGNETQKIRKVYTVDDVPPEITLNGDTSMFITLGGTYEEKGATAKDEKDGDLTDSIVTEAEDIDTSKEGEYKVTYKVSDSKGNEATKTRTITVAKTEEVKAKPGIDGEKGVIYLTFDDGPSTSTTPKILDILKKKGVKATFFILNYNSTGEKLVKREVEEGHTVGIHGYSHDYKKIYKSVDTYMENITKLQAKIKKSTGYTATITRFPGGSSNTVSRYNPGIMTKLAKEVPKRGFKYFDWNVNSADAENVKSSKAVYNNVTKGISKSKANVVLMHDFSGNTKTLNALEDIIDYGIKNGYTFKNITEDTPMVTHKPNN